MRRDEFPIVHMAIKESVLKVLEDVKAFIDDEDIIFWNLAERKKLIGFIDRKIAEVKGDNVAPPNQECPCKVSIKGAKGKGKLHFLKGDKA